MPRRLILPLSILGLLPVLLGLVGCSPQMAAVPGVLAAPNVFSGPVNGGCYLDTITTCRIHIDRWQPIVPNTGEALDGFQLVALPGGSARDSILYDFRTDVSNPPRSSYLPSLVKKDFAAQCGISYQLSLRVKDSGDLGFEEAGRTDQFQCPVAATVTPSPTPTPDPSPQVTRTPAGTPAPQWQFYLPAVRGEK